MAQGQGMDLIEVAPNAHPPVCKIMNYGKFKYEQDKKERLQRQHQRDDKVKEIQLHPHIDVHDFETKLRHIKEFLADGMKVRVSIVYRGREMAHQEFGRELAKTIMDETKELAVVEAPPKQLGKLLGFMLRPEHKSGTNRTGQTPPTVGQI